MSKHLNFLFSLLLCNLVLRGLASDDEERLVRDLFKGYNKLIRPAANISSIISVRFQIALFQIIDVDEKNQIMKTNVWLTTEWPDYQLQWDPEEYGGTKSIRLPPDKIWKPEIVLFNNADGNYEVTYNPNVVIYYEGNVLYVPPAIYKTSCLIDVEFFPFDQQVCSMRFGSWVYNSNELILNIEGQERMVLNDYVISGAWDLMDAIGIPNFYREHGPKRDIIFYLTIRRKTLFYTLNLITPCVLISFLSVLLFYLPADAGEKITLGISILLSLVVFLLLVSKILPPTSVSLSLISKYLLFAFVMNIVSILVTIIIINWNHRSPVTHKMPKWIRILFLKILPKLLFIRRPLKARISSKLSGGFCRTYGSPSPSMELVIANPLPCRSIKKPSYTELLGKMCSQAKKVAEASQFVAKHMRDEDECNMIKEDWKYVALVIDRLQLYIFFIITATGSMGLLLNAPYIFQSVDQYKVIQTLSGTNGPL